jgi:cytochrome d ubiquinol oxidase subunit II
LVAGPAAEPFTARLLGSWWSWPLQLATGACALGALTSLQRRSYVVARALAVAQVALIVVGWGAAQHPFLIAPDVTIDNAAAPDVVLNLLAPILVVGTLALSPAIYWLFRVFKLTRRPTTSVDL